MEKIRLSLENLEVQSFATGVDGTGGRGTVFGRGETEAGCVTEAVHGATCYEGCAWESWDNNSCDNSCQCMSAACGGSGDCPSGGWCNTFFASGCRW